MPSTLASLIASSSLLASITKIRREAAHVADAAERQLELVALAGQLQHFLLGEARSVPGELLLKALEALDRAGNGLPVGEHAAQPAVVDVMLAGTARRLGDRLLRLALGADEQHLAVRADRLAHEIERAGEQANALRQIDNVDAVALTEDVRLHLRVPAVGLVAEMRSGLEQSLHADAIGRRGVGRHG
jgi:hypothetical protein